MTFIPRAAGILFCVFGTVLSWLFGVLLRPPLIRGELFTQSAAAWQFLFAVLLPTFAFTWLAMYWLPRRWRIPLGTLYTAAVLFGLFGG